VKLVSLLVASVGVLALLLGGIERALKTFILDISPVSYLSVAATLFLLALVLIEYDRTYRVGKKV
jgi:hypothetical protein